MAAYLSLEQSLAGNACFSMSMIADLARAAESFGNRGYRYVYFEAGAIGQRLYLGAEALNWNATGIGAFYDDEVHRYLGLLNEDAPPVDASMDAAERAALVMLGSPASRQAASRADPPNRIGPSPKLDDGNANKGRESSRVVSVGTTDSSRLPQQVIYHFAIGRAIPDPRIEG
jgi:hypothetical protein